MTKWREIPLYDCYGNKLEEGCRAVLFSERGIHYEGEIRKIGRKRWFVVNEVMRIGGIGTCSITKINN